MSNNNIRGIDQRGSPCGGSKGAVKQSNGPIVPSPVPRPAAPGGGTKEGEDNDEEDEK